MNKLDFTIAVPKDLNLNYASNSQSLPATSKPTKDEIMTTFGNARYPDRYPQV